MSGCAHAAGSESARATVCAADARTRSSSAALPTRVHGAPRVAPGPSSPDRPWPPRVPRTGEPLDERPRAGEALPRPVSCGKSSARPRQSSDRDAAGPCDRDRIRTSISLRRLARRRAAAVTQRREPANEEEARPDVVSGPPSRAVAAGTISSSNGTAPVATDATPRRRRPARPARAGCVKDAEQAVRHLAHSPTGARPLPERKTRDPRRRSRETDVVRDHR